ncbi:MAG: hypothetical protein ABJC12_02620 [Saprospiraceae bacterium]
MIKPSVIIASLLLIAGSIFAQNVVPGVHLGNDTTICFGKYLVLSALLPMSCNPDYLWNDGSVEPNRIITKSGTYWVQVQSSCGEFQDTIKINFAACNAGCNSLSSISGIYSSPKSDIRGKSLVPAPENDGFYVAGSENDSVLIVKVDLSGKILWSRTFEIIPGGKHYINAMTIDQDGVLAVAGTFYLDFSGRYTSFMFRYDPKLNHILWAKEYIVEYSSTCLSMIQKPSSGNFLLSHESSDFLKTFSGGSILEIDKNTGEIVKVFGTDKTIFHDLIIKGNYIYGAGGYKGESEIYPRQTLVKMDAMNGNVVWAKSGEPYAQVGSVFAPDLLIDENFIYSIYSDSINKLHVQKTDINGNLIWLKEYEIPGRIVNANEIIRSINGYIIYAQIYDTQELVLFKIDKDGHVLWSRTYYTQTNTFGTQSSDAVGQIIEVTNEIVFTAFSVDSLGHLDIQYPNIIIGRTTLNGNILSSCVNQNNIIIPERNIENPIFFPVHPNSLNFTTETYSFNPSPHEVKINSRESCMMYDTIFHYVSAMICDGESVEGYSSPGMYSDTFFTNAGCDSIRFLLLIPGLGVSNFTNKSICSGAEFEGYSTSGIYVDTFNTNSGCDSIRTLQLNVISCLPVIYYNLDACRSVMAEGSQMDYSEFIPTYPSNLPCADITAHYLYRDSPQMNKHSCTPGVNNSLAMCVTTLNSCAYVEGSPASVVIEFSVNPSIDSVVQLTGLEFYQKGPATYNWVNGPTGPNNYPQFYALRILKNGIEIYRKENIQTTPDWKLQNFDFLDDTLFRITENSNFKIELLSYCPIDNGAEVSAWDLDEIKIYGGCVPKIHAQPFIKGQVLTRDNKAIPDANIYLSNNSTFDSSKINRTDINGNYSFSHLNYASTCFLKGYKNDNVRNGVSTLDLIYIQKHLLGIAPFTSLHQYIAADINRSENVSVVDLIELRKLILGIYSEFPQNTSWRFGSLPQEMNHSNISVFKETADIESLEQDSQKVDFVGIKIGDLNGDVQLYTDFPQIKTRNKKQFNVMVDEKKFERNQPFQIQFKSGDLQKITGMQFSLDLTGMDFISFSGISIPIAKDNYSVIDGKFRFSWNPDKPVLISQNDILFNIVLRPTGSGLLSNWLATMDQTLKPEIYIENLDVLDLHFEVLDSNWVSSQIDLFQIDPNPVRSAAKISFEIKEGGLTEIRFFDLSGRILHISTRTYSPGIHTEDMDFNDLNFPDGLLICQIKSNGFTKSIRFINLN